MARGKHGGYRQPAKPAAVSAPGSGARTDGGPGSKKQPLRAAPGQPYGARKASLDQQKAAPLPVDGSGGGAVAGQGPASSVSPPMGMPPDAFGPTGRPLEPANLGARPLNAGNQIPATAILRTMYAKRPSAWIARLLDGLD